MRDREMILETYRRALTHLLKRAHCTQHSVAELRDHVAMKLRSRIFQNAVDASAEASNRMEAIVFRLFELSDILDAIATSDPEFFAKLDAISDELQEVQTQLSGDDEKWET